MFKDRDACDDSVPKSHAPLWSMTTIEARNPEENDQANGPISTGQLSAFGYTHVHSRPINHLVSVGARGDDLSWRGLHA